MDARFTRLLACPACAGQLDSALRCAHCNQSYPITGDIPDLRIAAEAATERVRAFYSEAPFPGYPPRDSLSALRARAGRSDFALLLDAAIPGDAKILDLGCGTGQLGLFLASADRTVVGADLTRPSLALAAQAARRYGIDNAAFIETDLRRPGLRQGAFDVVICTGVLHHTPDPRASFAAVAKLARPGGVVLIGLYNAYARIPHRLRRGLARLTNGRSLPLDPVLRDRGAEPERRRAWLRDQYQHPEEHRHTVGEVRDWFRANQIDWLRSLPGALLGQDALAATELFEASQDDWMVEDVLAQLAWAATTGREGGLFVALGRRRAPA